jgi:site-specific DNA recombinase
MPVAVYARVSTQRQAQAQTIEQQLERLRAHCDAQSWTLRDTYVFRDDGYSGASLHRPGLDRLREAAAAGEVDRVLLTAPDRLARNYVHQTLLLEELEQVGCTVEFLDRPMSCDPNDQLLLQIRGAVAEYERSVIAERMRRGRQRKLRAGLLLPWTRAPYGYRLDTERPRDPAGVRVEPGEAAVVQEIFASYLADAGSLLGLAKLLGRRQIPTPNGQKHWSTATVRGILTNPSYTGHVYAGRTQTQPPRNRHSATHPIGRPSTTSVPTAPETWIPVATIPAVVSAEQFEQVQAKLARNQQFARRHNTTHDYLLRALVSCGVCQMACVGRSDPHHAYDYYVCRGKGPPEASHRAERCPARYTPAQQLDELVWQDLCAVLTHPASIADALDRAHGGQWSSQELQARRDLLRQGRIGLEHQRDRLTDAYLGGVIPLPEYQRRRAELEQKLEGIEQQAGHLTVQAAQQADVAAHVRGATDFCDRVQAGLADATFAQRRQMVELLIDRVVVLDGEVEIRYVIPTSLRGEHTRFCHLRLDYFDLPVGPVGSKTPPLGFPVNRHALACPDFWSRDDLATGTAEHPDQGIRVQLGEEAVEGGLAGGLLVGEAQSLTQGEGGIGPELGNGEHRGAVRQNRDHGQGEDRRERIARPLATARVGNRGKTGDEEAGRDDQGRGGVVVRACRLGGSTDRLHGALLMQDAGLDFLSSYKRRAPSSERIIPRVRPADVPPTAAAKD